MCGLDSPGSRLGPATCSSIHVMNFLVQRRWKISCAAEQLLTSQGGLLHGISM